MLKITYKGQRPRRRSCLEEWKRRLFPQYGVWGAYPICSLTSSLNFCLFFAVPPQKIKIIDDSGRDCTGSGVVGPYRIGDTAVLKCIAYGGERCLKNCTRKLQRPLELTINKCNHQELLENRQRVETSCKQCSMLPHNFLGQYERVFTSPFKNKIQQYDCKTQSAKVLALS